MVVPVPPPPPSNPPSRPAIPKASVVLNPVPRTPFDVSPVVPVVEVVAPPGIAVAPIAVPNAAPTLGSKVDVPLPVTTMSSPVVIDGCVVGAVAPVIAPMEPPRFKSGCCLAVTTISSPTGAVVPLGIRLAPPASPPSAEPGMDGPVGSCPVTMISSANGGRA